MKLYYWDDVETLAGYTTGNAFALANSKEEAIELICGSVFSHKVAKLKKELENCDPEVYETPVGFSNYGSPVGFSNYGSD